MPAVPKPEPRRKPRKGARDPVTGDLRSEVLDRDGGCVAVILGAEGCKGRLTLDHVKDEPRMGRRAPSDARHLVTLCEHHHLGGWATSHRSELRAYLREV
jgi:hypothetical protein